MFVGNVKWGLGQKKKTPSKRSNQSTVCEGRSRESVHRQKLLIKGLKTVKGDFIVTGLNSVSVVGIV